MQNDLLLVVLWCLVYEGQCSGGLYTSWSARRQLQARKQLQVGWQPQVVRTPTSTLQCMSQPDSCTRLSCFEDQFRCGQKEGLVSSDIGDAPVWAWAAG